MGEPPQPVVDFREALEAAGFELVEQRRGSGFDDQLIRLASDVLWVDITSDRGQWFARIGADGWSQGFDADVWRAELEGGEPHGEVSDLASDLAYFRSVLPRMAERADAATYERLERSQRARASRRYGIDL